MSNQDAKFLQILQEEKNVLNLLDSFFGFLSRCTDFYVEWNSKEKPGSVERLVLNTLKKWKTTSLKSEPESITNDENIDDKKTFGKNEMNKSDMQLFNSYNGAIRDNYSWSQTISNLDVTIALPNYIESPKDIKVDLNSDDIKIEVNIETKWMMIFEGKFNFKIRKNESIWSLLSKRYINIHIEKDTEMWWDALIYGEPKIQLNKIDCSRDISELKSDEQMKIEELMWKHQQKILGKTVSE